ASGLNCSEPVTHTLQEESKHGGQRREGSVHASMCKLMCRMRFCLFRTISRATIERTFLQ
ncbi:hypothetical protein KUCAC02_001131, partial [Chaenocephalus aceratus]